MKTIHVATAFTLVLKGHTLHIGPGIQPVDDEVADHWFTKVHLANGGLGEASYAAAARQSADNAFVKAKEAVALYVSLERAAGDAEEAAGVDRSEPAFERLGHIIDPTTALSNPEPGQGDDPRSVDDMTDDELRNFIKQRDGRSPHPATSHDKLLAAAKGDKATSAEIEADPAAPPAPPAPPSPPAAA